MQLIDTKNEGEDLDLKDKLVELAELPLPKKSKSKTKTNNKDNKRKRTSSVCHFFQMLPKRWRKAYLQIQSVERNILLLEYMVLEI